jgi:hypothetical protein
MVSSWFFYAPGGPQRERLNSQTARVYNIGEYSKTAIRPVPQNNYNNKLNSSSSAPAP